MRLIRRNPERFTELTEFQSVIDLKIFKMTRTLYALTSLNILILLANLGSPALSGFISSRFELTARAHVTEFPVPSVRPTTAGQVVGFDVYPSIGAIPHPDNGYAWFDACDKDLMTANGDVPVTCARMGVQTNRVEFGSRNFDGGAQKDVWIVRDRQVIAKFDAAGLTVFGTVKASGFLTVGAD